MSTYIDATSGAVDHCEAMAKSHPDLADDYNEISSMVSNKLWHQLTVKLLDFLADSKNFRTTEQGTSSFLALYNEVVLVVDKKLNQTSLARLASLVSSSLLFTDGTAAKAVLENLLQHKDRLGVSATLYCESKLALLKLNLLESNGQPVDMDELKTLLQRNASLLAEMPYSQDYSIVHSAHHLASMTFRKAVGPPEAFYKEAVLYLNYTAMQDIDNAYQLAVDLSLAALTGDGVFNFGQVVTTPILSVLQDTPHEWLMKLMQASAKGDVLLFQELLQQHAAEIQKEPALVNRAQAVQEKITLLALVHLVFERPSSERTLSFQDVAQRIHLDVSQVELVVMRALSLGLIEGTMDQVEQTVQVTWVLPRVLDKEQMQELSTRFGEWAVKVSSTRDYMGEQTVSTFA
jgi:26S proteasome regulatory subunit N9